MHKWFSIFTLLAIMLFPARANAQSAVSLDQVDIAIWPEYDTTDVLVIYKIALSPETPLPAEITLRLPASVQKTAVVAVGDSAETVSDKDVVSSVVPGADFTRVSIKASGQFIQVEYYDSNLAKTGNERQYAFEWPGDFAAKQFRFGLREPLKSSNVKVDPALPVTGTDAEGFRFGEFTQADIKEGQKLSFNISYQRDTDSPSTSFLQVQPSTPLTQPVPGQSTWTTTYLPWALGGLGLILLLIAGGVYLASGKANRASAKSRKRHAARSEEDDDDEGPVHCSQCGKRTQPGDRFCRVCGARIRRIDA